MAKECMLLETHGKCPTCFTKIDNCFGDATCRNIIASLDDIDEHTNPVRFKQTLKNWCKYVYSDMGDEDCLVNPFFFIFYFYFYFFFFCVCCNTQKENKNVKKKIKKN